MPGPVSVQKSAIQKSARPCFCMRCSQKQGLALKTALKTNYISTLAPKASINTKASGNEKCASLILANLGSIKLLRADLARASGEREGYAHRICASFNTRSVNGPTKRCFNDKWNCPRTDLQIPCLCLIATSSLKGSELRNRGLMPGRR